MSNFDFVNLIGFKDSKSKMNVSKYENKFLSELKERFNNSNYFNNYSEDKEEEVLNLLKNELNNGFENNDKYSLFVINFSLNEILSKKYILSYDSNIETSPLIFKIEQKIIESQLQSDLKIISKEMKPKNSTEFKEWFAMKCNAYSKSPHTLFEFLEKSATFEQFKDFIKIEAAVHVSFDDVIALTQVGVRGNAKVEFFHNFQDELGSHDPDKFHLTMFGNLISQLEINEIYKDKIEWEALSCGNYMMFLAYYRCFYHYCIGYLGFLEALTPGRFSSIAKAGARLGLSKHSLAYHFDHSELDLEHAEGWLNKIIIPEINEKGSRISEQIATGVLLREHVSNRYWDAILNKYL